MKLILGKVEGKELFYLKEARQRVINYIKDHVDVLEKNQVTVGIDAFIDKIMRLIHSKHGDEIVFFSDIAQFGNHLVSKAGKSCQVELNERFTKLGGNAPIMANAMGALGVKINLASALGYPIVDPIFKELSSNCKLFTIGNPGYTTALEFDDGKVMLSQRDYLNIINWSSLKDVLGLDTIKKFFNESKLISLVNWTGIMRYNDILRGILNEVMPEHTPNKDQILFFDMCDFSERTSEDVCEAVTLFNEFSKHFKVVLGVNENEGNLLYKALFPGKEIKDWVSVNTEIYEHLNVDAYVVHTLTSSMAWDAKGTSQVDSLFVQKPKLSTGGGDNFNAGLCFGMLLGLDFEGALYTANATSGYYVRNAHSPSIDNLVDTLNDWDQLIETP